MFKEFPYLYCGTADCERGYLDVYYRSPDVVVLLIFDGDEVVGFSNSIPLAQESGYMQRPFIAQGLDVTRYLYIGEVMLYEPYRGKGILRKFLEFHEQTARATGYTHLIFMTVARPDNYPCIPQGYRSLEPIWNHFGYEKVPGLYIEVAWMQVDTCQETHNILPIWQKIIPVHV